MDFVICNQLSENHPHYNIISHAGDVILSRPIITTIRNTFSDLNIILQFNNKYHYLFQDLGLPMRDIEKIKEYNYNAWFGCYNDIMVTYGLTYLGQVHSFNRQMEAQRLPYKLTSTDYPMLKFPPSQFVVAPNSILLENGPCFSGQNDIDINAFIPRLVSDFKNYIFYTTAPSPVKAPNIIDFHDKNLVELSNLSNSCVAIVARGGAVFVACYTEENRNKPRMLVGWNFPHKPWDKFLTCRSYEELCSFMRSLNRRIK
jgi:hypothetical protein